MDKADELQSAVEEAAEALAEAVSDAEESEAEVKRLQTERAAIVKERNELDKKMTAEETVVEQLRSKLHTVLQKVGIRELDQRSTRAVRTRTHAHAAYAHMYTCLPLTIPTTYVPCPCFDK